MRPSFPDLMQGLFWLVMAIVVLLVGLYAITVLDGIAKRQQQGTALCGRHSCGTAIPGVKSGRT